MADAEVMIWQIPGHPRSRSVCSAMYEGVGRAGGKPLIRTSAAYKRPEGRVGVFYGMAGHLARALTEYPQAGRTCVYVDMGYWGRKEGGRFVGYHKLSVNGRHPTAYFQRQAHTAERFERFGIDVKPWRQDPGPNAPILIAGMGPKGSRAEGYEPQGWERRVVALLRRVTKRPLWYRPKPNVDVNPPIPGTIMVSKDADLLDQLRGCHALVAHHSNAALEAIAGGYPAFVVEGVALPVAGFDLAQVETPVMVDEATRRQWLADVAWTQWNIEEMRRGDAWRYLKSEGLV